MPKSNQPTLTLKSLNERLDSQALFATSLRKRLDDTLKGTRRHSLQAKALDARIDAVLKEVSSCKERLRLLTKKSNELNDGQAALFTNLTDQVAKMVNELNSDVNTQLAAHSKQLDGLHEAVGDLQTRANDTDDLFEELAGRQRIIGRSTASAHARIDLLRNRTRIPAWAYALATIAGIIAAIGWYTHNWTKVIKLNATTTLTLTNHPADTWWVALLFGIAIFAIALGATAFLQRTPNGTHGEHTEEDQVQAQAHAQAQVVARPANTAPTAPNPTGR